MPNPKHPDLPEEAVEAAMKYGLFRRSEAEGLVEAIYPAIRKKAQGEATARFKRLEDERDTARQARDRFRLDAEATALQHKPTDDTLTLVAFLLGCEWLTADEIRHALGRLGFELPSSQWVAAHLTAMTKEDAPRFEADDRGGLGFREYRVTSWAVTGLRNEWDGFGVDVVPDTLDSTSMDKGEGS